MNSELFPLDFEALNKGDTITQNQIESIYQTRYAIAPDEYRRKMMDLGSRIERERPGELLVKYDGLTLRIMTDHEADEVTHKRIVHAVGTIGRNSHRRAAINRDEFSGEQKKVAESRDMFATTLALATRKELRRAKREQMLLSSPKADEPKLPETGSDDKPASDPEQ